LVAELNAKAKKDESVGDEGGPRVGDEGGDAVHKGLAEGKMMEALRFRSCWAPSPFSSSCRTLFRLKAIALAAAVELFVFVLTLL
jgi:hypothetical protein